MAKNYRSAAWQPTIVKYVQVEPSGIMSHNQTRHGIGFVLRGNKYIYSGDSCLQIKQGNLFYLNPGNHYFEDIPENNKPFEQIIFYYTPEQLGSILSHLSISFGLNVENSHKCSNCTERKYVIYPSWNSIRNFFTYINQYLTEGIVGRDEMWENLKMAELIYLIVSNSDCCLKTKVLENTDLQKESFEQIVHQNIFNDISIEKLAQECNRSLTSFKKEFKRLFFEPPHKWFIRQRLMHARLLLISTSKSVAEIGNECNFPNTSHFIKLFKKEYEMTPAAYRNRHLNNKQTVKEFSTEKESEADKQKTI